MLKYGLDQYELPADPQQSGITDALGVLKPLTAAAAVATLAGLGISFATGVGYKRPTMRYDEANHDVVDADTGEVIKHIDREAGEL